jgi:Mn-dependent DtxR family transcriptional regulator
MAQGGVVGEVGVKPREARLRHILSLLAEAPEAVDGTRLRGRVCRDHQVAPSTASSDLRDLTSRGWVIWEYGRLTITQAGLRASCREPEEEAQNVSLTLPKQ